MMRSPTSQTCCICSRWRQNGQKFQRISEAVKLFLIKLAEKGRNVRACDHGHGNWSCCSCCQTCARKIRRSTYMSRNEANKENLSPVSCQCIYFSIKAKILLSSNASLGLFACWTGQAGSTFDMFNETAAMSEINEPS